MKIRILRLLAACGLSCVLGTCAYAAPVVIAHPSVSTEKIDGASLKAVFLGKKVAWDGAGRIVLAVLKSGPIADEFLPKTTDLSASAFNNHWRRLAMTGGGTAPKTFDNEADLRKFVAETPGAVGFIDEASVDPSVVVLSPAR